MRLISILSTAYLLSFSILLADQARSASAESQTQPTAEDRESMAKAHEKMAACLRSTKTLNECRTEMMTSCKQMGSSCPMLGQQMGQGQGMMKNKER